MDETEIEQLVDEYTNEVFLDAVDVYDETVCGPAGCCGDLHGAIRVAIRRTIQRMSNAA